jgi:uncharacterized membrane protein YcgQ (UPF0703/DUF1980 family)
MKNVIFCSHFADWSVLADWSAANEYFILYLIFPNSFLAKILLEIKGKIIIMVFEHFKEQKIAVIWIFHIISLFWFILDALRRFWTISSGCQSSLDP